MPTATKNNKKKAVRKPTPTGLKREASRLRSRVEDAKDARDLEAAVARNKGKPGTAWKDAKTLLGLS